MDKRRERRVPVKDPMKFETPGKPGEGTMINLSVNGCAFESGVAIDPNVPLQLELCIPNENDPVRVNRARVTWKAKDGMGVEFLNMNATSKARLEHYLASLTQQAS